MTSGLDGYQFESISVEDFHMTLLIPYPVRNASAISILRVSVSATLPSEILPKHASSILDLNKVAASVGISGSLGEQHSHLLHGLIAQQPLIFNLFHHRSNCISLKLDQQAHFLRIIS